MCIQAGCKTRARFNFSGEKKPLYCGTHKLQNMMNISTKKCEHDGCMVRAQFNVPGLKSGIYCFEHKLDGMINVINKKCAEKDCFTRPVYNSPDKTVGIYCFSHKKEGMEDVVSKKCAENGCKIKPNYNTPGNTIGLYCVQHKKENMEDVTCKRCAHEGCNKNPSFNVPTETIGLYCSAHKLEGMEDVTHKKCAHKGCKIQPCFNFERQRPLYCVEHKLEGMVCVVSKTCEYEGCRTIPIFNIMGEKNGKFCAKHKTEEMVDVVNKTCKNEWCNTGVKDKYEGYCLYCYVNKFPDRPVSRNYKKKEFAVVEFVTKTFPNFAWISDKRVVDGCSKRRPDLLLDLGYQVIIVEVDENQHIKYDCSCENRRLMEISMDLQHRPIVFIRFNPDDYIENGAIIKSCWGYNTTGLSTVKQGKKKEWEKRLDALQLQIEYWTTPQNITNKTVEIVQLFYDNY